jgi:nitroreductase
MDVFEAIKKRHSVRRYKPDPVPDAVLEQVLEAARLAPSWSNTQCWRFIVVKDQETKVKLTETNPANRAMNSIREAPVVIVACAEIGRSGYKGGQLGTDKTEWFMFDVAIAMQNMVLTAWALGLGTVYVGLFDAQKAAKLLNVPQGSVVVAMTPLGYPAEEPRESVRKEMSEVVFAESFGKPWK